MNALDLLTQDHEEVKELFEQAEGTEESNEQRNIFNHIKKALEAHARIEEGAFYPAMEKHEQLKDLVLESYEEHKQVKHLEIDDLVAGSEKFEPKLRVLQEIVEHHAEEEEEGKMFPQVQELVDDAALEELGRKLEAAKGIQSQAV